MLTVLSYFAVFVVGFLFGLGVMSILAASKVADLESEIMVLREKLRRR